MKLEARQLGTVRSGPSSGHSLWGAVTGSESSSWTERMLEERRRDWKERRWNLDPFFKEPNRFSPVPILELKFERVKEQLCITQIYPSSALAKEKGTKDMPDDSDYFKLLWTILAVFSCAQALRTSSSHARNQQRGTPQKSQHHLSKERTWYGRRKAGLFSAYMLCRTLKYK